MASAVPRFLLPATILSLALLDLTATAAAKKVVVDGATALLEFKPGPARGGVSCALA